MGLVRNRITPATAGKRRCPVPERDPRVDPKPGDIIRFGGRYGGSYVEVLDRDFRDDIEYMSEGKALWLSLNPWREHTATATVIRRAELGTGERKDAEK